MATLPVKDKSFTRSSTLKNFASSVRQGSIEKEPSGKPLLAKISPKIDAEIGVRSDGFNRNGQPAAIAGPTLWAYSLEFEYEVELGVSRG